MHESEGAVLAEFVEKMQAQRFKRGWSQRHLAKLVGTSRSQIAMIESMKTSPSFIVMCRIMMTLDITLSGFFQIPKYKKITGETK